MLSHAQPSYTAASVSQTFLICQLRGKEKASCLKRGVKNYHTPQTGNIVFSTSLHDAHPPTCRKYPFALQCEFSVMLGNLQNSCDLPRSQEEEK